jgi:hypothetical protein
MRRRIVVALAVSSIVTGCRSGQQDQSTSGSTAGTTTRTTGTPTVTRSETTRVSSDTTQGVVRSDVSVTLDRASYAAGATVTMTVRNQGRDTLGYNQCSSRAVERQEGSTWAGVPEPSRMCTMELRLLTPNETQAAKTDLPATLVPGTYRLVLTLGRQSTAGGSVRAVSPTFRVT